jgi:16S rRNA (cytidine1402-2'-O)-methyltransferase
VPGPSALVAALSVCGLPTDAFSFAGFLPSRPGPRRRRLAELLARGETTVFFEAPHRVRTTLKLLHELAPAARVAACREMTKKFEEVLRGSPEAILSVLTTERERGEWTLVVAPEPPAGGEGAGRQPPKRAAARKRDPVARWIEEQVRQGTSPEEAHRRAEFLYGGPGTKRRRRS